MIVDAFEHGNGVVPCDIAHWRVRRPRHPGDSATMKVKTNHLFHQPTAHHEHRDRRPQLETVHSILHAQHRAYVETGPLHTFDHRPPLGDEGSGGGIERLSAVEVVQVAIGLETLIIGVLDRNHIHGLPSSASTDAAGDHATRLRAALDRLPRRTTTLT